MVDDDANEQLALVPTPRRRTPRPTPTQEAAERLPVAKVLVDSGLPHLDRPFDYLVPADLDAAVVSGCRVKVRFSGRQVDGFVVERTERTDHHGRLAFLAKVVSSEPVLRPEVLAAAREVARRCAGTVGDVLRLAVPPRHAATEKVATREPGALPQGEATSDPLDAFRDALGRKASPRACWSVLPTHDVGRSLGFAARAALTSGRGTIVCVADQRDVDRTVAAMREVLGDAVVALTASQKPAARYRAFLALARGVVKVVVGTRAAAFAPVHDLGLVAIVDDGDDLFAEPRAPYPHAREVLLTRAAQVGAGVLVAGHARSAEAQMLVETGYCSDVVPSIDERRAAWASLEVSDGSETGAAPVRLPRAVFRAIRDADGPVLVQVPRRGYRSALACQQCRTPASCRTCGGPLAQAGAGATPACVWCGVEAADWACPVCRGTTLRSPVVGQLRTAEEFGAAFGDREVVTSGGSTVLASVDAPRALVLATPGAEPPHVDGYAAVVLLDTWLMLARQDMRVVEESHRRWFNALALARPGGRAVAVGEPGVLQALVRADPVGLAARELDARRDVRLPPTARVAAVEASPTEIASLDDRRWTDHTDVLGPVEVDDDTSRLVLRVPRAEGLALADVLRDENATRSAAKRPLLRVRVDPQQM